MLGLVKAFQKLTLDETPTLRTPPPAPKKSSGHSSHTNNIGEVRRNLHCKFEATTFESPEKTTKAPLVCPGAPRRK
jgi:hypothetical protein